MASWLVEGRLRSCFTGRTEILTSMPMYFFLIFLKCIFNVNYERIAHRRISVYALMLS